MIEPFFNIYPCIEGHTGCVFSLDCSKMTNRIYSAGMDKIIRVWNRDTGELLKVIEGHEDWIRCVKLSIDEKVVITAS